MKQRWGKQPTAKTFHRLSNTRKGKKCDLWRLKIFECYVIRAKIGNVMLLMLTYNYDEPKKLFWLNKFRNYKFTYEPYYRVIIISVGIRTSLSTHKNANEQVVHCKKGLQNVAYVTGRLTLLASPPGWSNRKIDISDFSLPPLFLQLLLPSAGLQLVMCTTWAYFSLYYLCVDMSWAFLKYFYIACFQLSHFFYSKHTGLQICQKLLE